MHAITESSQKLRTVGDFFRFAITCFAQDKVYLGHGTDTLEDEAWWLVAGALKLPLHLEKGLFLQAKLTLGERQHLASLIHSRSVDKIPTAYLLKEAYQHGYKFYVDDRVLIPRSPIAELILRHCEPWVAPDSVTRILDLCTGSGVLAILAALTFPNAEVDASDLSPAALAVAAENVRDYELTTQIHLVESNVFAQLKSQKYDVILSNPPYVDAHDLKSMPAEYHHEPKLALESGEDGLDVVKKVLAEASAHLNPHGILIVEVGNSRLALEAAFPRLPFIWLDFESGGEGVFLLKAEDFLGQSCLEAFLEDKLPPT